jgi:serine/threonine-protein kinase
MRSKLLAEVKAEDPAMAIELDSLLSAHDSSDDYFGKLSRDVIAPAVIAVSLDETEAGANLQSRLEKALTPAYKIERELGRGGMSRVFLATEIRLARRVVIKVLPPDMSVGVSIERFQREIQLSARLQHPHIVHVLTSDAADGLLYYVMPYVEGETLRSRIARDGALPVSDALAIWRDLLDALGFAHQQGIVHRDVKPENILLSGRHALIADFGIARALEAAADEKENATAAGVTLGTPAYMAPEQVSGEGDADHRIDIYAAGLVMYEMLAGRTPFAGRGTRDTVLAHISQSPPPIARPDLPAPLDKLVMQCLEKLPESRPQNAESILRELDTMSPASAAQIPRKRRSIAIAGAMAAVALLLVGGAYFVRREAAPSQANAEVGTLAGDARPSLVVLPLTNRSTDPTDAGLADGMTEELIGTLSRDSSIRVIASTSAFALKGTKQGIRQIADSLNVSNVLEGSLQKLGPRLRMQVRLVDARNGSTRWSQVYDRQMDDLFAVEEDISRAVAAELGARLEKNIPSNPRGRYTPNVVAYEWYVRGMDIALMRSDTGTQRSIEYFNRAIAADSNFAAAYAGLVRAYLQLGNARRGGKGSEWFDEGEKAARRAVALDSSLADGYAALGWALLTKSDEQNAESAFKKAVALNPSAPRLHEGIARLYMATNRPAEELVEARAGLAVDPFSTSAIREVALALIMNGRCDEALKLLEPLKSLSPPAGVAGIIRGQCYESKQMWNEAIAEYQWAMTHASGASGPAFLGHALARAGRQDEARRILSQLLSGGKDSHGAFGIAVVYAGLRDYDNAFAWLNKAADERSITSYIYEPMFDDLHTDPRYAAIMKRRQYQKR